MGGGVSSKRPIGGGGGGGGNSKGSFVSISGGREGRLSMAQIIFMKS